MPTNPKVFISYSHQDSKYADEVFEFSGRLREKRIDADLDQYYETPPGGLQLWMDRSIENADFVIIICNESYYKKIYQPERSGAGVRWEVSIIYNHIYHTNNTKFIPVVFNSIDSKYIPTPLKSRVYYNVGNPSEFNNLCEFLSGERKERRPPLGALSVLPQKVQRTKIVSLFNEARWSEAQWCGVTFAFPDNLPPVLGLVFRDISIANAIFSNWIKEIERTGVKRILKVDFVLPPFPDNSWMKRDDFNPYGIGYHICLNVSKEYAQYILNEPEKEKAEFIITSSKLFWVPDVENDQTRIKFQKSAIENKGFLIAPAGLYDNNKPCTADNIRPEVQVMIDVDKLEIKIGTELEGDNGFSFTLKHPLEVV